MRRIIYTYFVALALISSPVLIGMILTGIGIPAAKAAQVVIPEKVSGYGMYINPTTSSQSILSVNFDQGEAIRPLDSLSHRQRAWLGALEWCESGGRPGAINPKDRDGTPSNGILQFKPSTFAYYQKVYNVTGTLMDADAQEDIVASMIQDGDRIDWHHQFPDCTKKLGTPPKQ